MFDIYPIGYVRKLEGDRSEIKVFPRFAEGLKGINRREHLLILFWMHRLLPPHRRVMLVHPMGDKAREKLGVFALRSPMRPNPIGVTRVKLIEISENRIIVEGLDALDGSPVIDIKAG
jgi:tRNA-Thr(GGU) m(6)t(6)A37 methyltransferase TsaA